MQIQHATANWPDRLENITKDTLNDVCGRIQQKIFAAD